MPIRCRSQAEKAIGTCESVFVSVIYEAHDKFYDTCGPIAAVLGGGTKASIIRDLALEGLARFAAVDPSFVMSRRGNAISFMRDGFCFRVKSLDERKRAKPPRTDAGRRFDRNIQDERQKSFDLGDDPLTTGYLGYAANIADLHRPTIYFVVNGQDGRHAWPPLELTALDVGGSGDVPQIAAPQEDEPETRSRARVKKTPEKKRKGNG